VIKVLESYIKRLLSSAQTQPIKVANNSTTSIDSLKSEKSPRSIDSIKSIEMSENHSNQLDAVEASVNILLKLMWEDWSNEVRDAASLALGNLGKGRSIFDHIVNQLQSEHSGQRLEALKCLAHLGIMTQGAMKSFIKCFSDFYSIIRLEACKVACVLKTDNREIIAALMDRMDDFDYKVRAFAVKGILKKVQILALGQCKSKQPKNRALLTWAIIHDPSPTVRAEALHALRYLGLIVEDASIKDAVTTVYLTDSCDMVRKEAEKAMHEGTIKEGDENAFGFLLLNRVPFPHILNGKTVEEVDIFLRKGLVQDKEQSDVISQVKNLTEKTKVIQEVGI
jgi:HEAT repeat protein